MGQQMHNGRGEREHSWLMLQIDAAGLLQGRGWQWGGTWVTRERLTRDSLQKLSGEKPAIHLERPNNLSSDQDTAEGGCSIIVRAPRSNWDESVCNPCASYPEPVSPGFILVSCSSHSPRHGSYFTPPLYLGQT